MRTRSMLIALVVLALAVNLPRCGDATAGPEALVKRFAAGLETLDEEQIAACFDPGTSDVQRVAALVLGCVKVLKKERGLGAAVREKFGDAFADRELGRAGPDLEGLVRRIGERLARGRVRVEGDTATLQGEGSREEPVRMVRNHGVWTFAVAPYLPDDPNLCDNVNYILACFLQRYESARKALDTAATAGDFAARLKELDQHLARSAKKAMETVEPFLLRYR